jgi:2-amino-4-hydroxy-6-hydroxymethyldihydropteridine diphosphokinase
MAYIGLGGNQGAVDRALALAREALSALQGIRVQRVSRVYRTNPQGLQEQPFFFNQVAALLCDGNMRPELLMDGLLDLEAYFGRVRSEGQKNGPRPLDLDLLLFGREERNTTSLVLPHPRMRERAFVLVPLAEIAPDLIFPDGQSIASALAGLHYTVRGNGIFQESFPSEICQSSRGKGDSGTEARLCRRPRGNIA